MCVTSAQCALVLRTQRSGWPTFRSQRRGLTVGTGVADIFAARQSRRRKFTMLRWALIFAVIALIAGFLGFAGIAGAAAGIAKFLFFAFLVIAAIVLILGLSIAKRV